jgi:hypothetical protein
MNMKKLEKITTTKNLDIATNLRNLHRQKFLGQKKEDMARYKMYGNHATAAEQYLNDQNTTTASKQYGIHTCGTAVAL